MNIYKYDDEFNDRLKEVRNHEKYDDYIKENSKLRRTKKCLDLKFSDFRLIQLNLMVLSLIVIAITFFSLYKIRNSTQVDLYIQSAVVTSFYVIVLIYMRDFIFKALFMYKGTMMDLYYQEHNNLVDSPTEVIYVPVSDNGRIIGILEGMLYGFGILVQSYTMIGVVLAIRSYVSVTSHNNKEESEFYIIGLMGSLLSSIIITGIYIISMYLISEKNILELISYYLPRIS